jgi:hypothetical protein
MPTGTAQAFPLEEPTQAGAELFAFGAAGQQSRSQIHAAKKVKCRRLPGVFTPARLCVEKRRAFLRKVRHVYSLPGCKQHRGSASGRG